MDPINSDYTSRELRNMVDAFVSTLQYANGRDDLFTQAAVVYRKTFVALVSQGFTDEQAIQIIANQGAVKLGT